MFEPHIRKIFDRISFGNKQPETANNAMLSIWYQRIIPGCHDSVRGALRGRARREKEGEAIGDPAVGIPWFVVSPGLRPLLPLRLHVRFPFPSAAVLSTAGVSGFHAFRGQQERKGGRSAREADCHRELQEESRNSGRAPAPVAHKGREEAESLIHFKSFCLWWLLMLLSSGIATADSKGFR